MAVTVSVADFRAEFPEFSATSDAAVQRALTEALLLHSIRKLATLYAAAHVLSVVPDTSTGGGAWAGQPSLAKYQ